MRFLEEVKALRAEIDALKRRLAIIEGGDFRHANYLTVGDGRSGKAGVVFRISSHDDLQNLSPDGAFELPGLRMDITDEATAGALLVNVNGVESGVIVPQGRIWNEPLDLAPTAGQTAFAMPFSFVERTVVIYHNGVRKIPGTGYDFTISGTTATFTEAPLLAGQTDQGGELMLLYGIEDLSA